MTQRLEIAIDGRLGLLRLNRPEAINALSRDMIDAIAAQLALWRNDDAIRAVLFTGNGPKGFCAGGDVRAIRQLMLDGRPEEADAYFAAEYAMNALIATFPKPLVALSHGVVMGGGIGIAGHCAFRLTTADARFAMPEAAIGFVADVGVNAILAQAPLHRALLFLLAGLPVGPADALALGLVDAIVPPAELNEMPARIAIAAAAGEVETALVGLLQTRGIPPGEARLCAHADLLEPRIDWSSAATIVAGVAAAAKAEPELEPLAAALASRSPTSLAAIHAGHLAARRLASVEAVLALDLRLASFMARRPDFAEGVRAVLVDRDQRPRWQPDGFVAVPHAAIAGITEDRA